MATEKHNFAWRKAARVVLGLGFSGILLYLAIRGMDLRETIKWLERISLSPAMAAVLFLFLSFLVRAWRWRYLLQPLKSVPVLPLFRSTVIGFMGNYVFPMRGGELLRAISIGQSQEISKSGALGSIVLERALDGITLSLIPFLLLAVLDLPSWLMRVNMTLFGIYVAGLSIVVISTIHGWTDVWLKRFMGFLPSSVAVRLGVITQHFFQGMMGLNRAGVLLPVSFLSLLCWFCHTMYYFLLFGALDLNLSFWTALVLEVVIALGVMLPAGPGYVGNFEYFTILGLAVFGISKEAALAYALLAHSFQLVPVTVVGLLFSLGSGFRSQAKVKA
jgi:hypothetical protein